MKLQTARAEHKPLWCEKTGSLTLRLSSELIGVLMWVNKYSAVLLKLVQ